MHQAKSFEVTFLLRFASSHFTLTCAAPERKKVAESEQKVARAPPLSLILYIIEFYDAHKYENV